MNLKSCEQVNVYKYKYLYLATSKLYYTLGWIDYWFLVYIFLTSWFFLHCKLCDSSWYIILAKLFLVMKDSRLVSSCSFERSWSYDLLNGCSFERSWSHDLLNSCSFELSWSHDISFEQLLVVMSLNIQLWDCPVWPSFHSFLK